MVRGHQAYYAVPGNSDAVNAFRTQVIRHWRTALRHRSQRTRINWDRMNRIATRWIPPTRTVHPFPASALRRHAPKVGAQCGNSARWDLRGGPLQRRSLPRPGHVVGGGVVRHTCLLVGGRGQFRSADVQGRG